jgi:hypothetical protein
VGSPTTFNIGPPLSLLCLIVGALSLGVPLFLFVERRPPLSLFIIVSPLLSLAVKDRPVRNRCRGQAGRKFVWGCCCQEVEGFCLSWLEIRFKVSWSKIPVGILLSGARGFFLAW